MTSVRPYKEALSREEAMGELYRCSGKQFDPRLVDVFQTVLNSDPLFSQQFSGRG
jgi:HD-GYP domain-containing protein (c-di-GMP phosphodiesterase class II)